MQHSAEQIAKAGERPKQRCFKCGGLFDKQAAFRITSYDGRYAYRPRAVCIGCEQKARDERKQRNRWLHKAEDTIRRHSQRLQIPRPVLIDRYQWTPQRIAHDFEHAYANGCRYCGVRYVEMMHGPSDITLDVINPLEPPYYAVNVTMCCQTCNREKSRLSPADWAERLRYWEQYEQLIALPSPVQKAFLFLPPK